MNKIIPSNTILTFVIAAVLLFANAPVGFAKPQKKSAGPGKGVTFTSNRNADSKTTQQINNILDSLHLEE